jgi:hypothetical protein
MTGAAEECFELFLPSAEENSENFFVAKFSFNRLTYECEGTESTKP